jgi:ATP-dependent DNA ligase
MTVKPHRAVDYSEPAILKVIAERGYVLAGIKVDGMRCHVLKVAGKVHFLTRAGIEIPALVNYAEYFEKRWLSQYNLADHHVLDCEVVLLGVDFETGCGILRRDEALQEHEPQFVVLDILTQDRLQGVCRAEAQPPFFARYANVVGRFPLQVGSRTVAPVVSESIAKVTSLAELQAVYETTRRLGWEGLVVKDPSCPPRNGKVTGAWKVKPGCGAEFAPGWEGDGKIVGYVWGDDEKANAGKIVGFRVALEDGTEVSTTGLTQEQMAEYTALATSMCPCDGLCHQRGLASDEVDRTCKAVYNYPLIGRYAEVKAMEKTKTGSLRHPRFIRFRDLDSHPGVKA